MFGIENYWGFVIAGIILNITPGSDTIYILSRSIAQGKRAGVYSVLGIGTGALFHTCLAAFGLSIILAKSLLAFNIVKYAGVAYLVFIGLNMILSKNQLFDNGTNQLERTDLMKIYRQGMFTNMLNPKVALFYISFLPQFINPEYADGPMPFLILGGTFMTTGTLWCFTLVVASSFITQTLRNNDRISKYLNKFCGIVFIGLGIKILVK